MDIGFLKIFFSTSNSLGLFQDKQVKGISIIWCNSTRKSSREKNKSFKKKNHFHNDHFTINKKHIISPNISMFIQKIYIIQPLLPANIEHLCQPPSLKLSITLRMLFMSALWWNRSRAFSNFRTMRTFEPVQTFWLTCIHLHFYGPPPMVMDIKWFGQLTWNHDRIRCQGLGLLNIYWFHRSASPYSRWR